VLRPALGDAARLGFVARDVARLSAASGRARRDADVAAEELGQFLAALDRDRRRAAYVVLATTGMRRGEVLGLHWSDEDFDGGHLSVEQTITASNHQP
jgi:integrase